MRQIWWRSLRGQGVLELQQSLAEVLSGGQRDLVVGGLDILAHKRAKQGVREVR
jgi:hypothetical protein